MTLRWESVVVDTADPAGLARWWAELLGWPVTHDDPDEVVIAPPGGRGRSPEVLFGHDVTPRTAPDRARLELGADDLDAAVARAEALGAVRVAGAVRAQRGRVVLADPDGNELFVRRLRTAPARRPRGDRPQP